MSELIKNDHCLSSLRNIRKFRVKLPSFKSSHGYTATTGVSPSNGSFKSSSQASFLSLPIVIEKRGAP